MERAAGIEPTPSAWKAAAPPLSYTRIWQSIEDSNPVLWLRMPSCCRYTNALDKAKARMQLKHSGWNPVSSTHDKTPAWVTLESYLLTGLDASIFLYSGTATVSYWFTVGVCASYLMRYLVCVSD
nr:MAG TPA: hypothetical protein [Caudoviricetes sp.]